jgi:predicted dehydrogenase
MEKVRWGIIGCGDVTEVKSGPAFKLIKNSELVAVMRRNGALAKDYAERHKVSKWYDNADSLINDPDVDAVYIATPPSSHKEYTIKTAEAGKPVYVEKPMAASYAECSEMVDFCNQKNVKLFVAYYRRALPRFLKIKSLIDGGAIGDICSVNIRFFQKPTKEDFASGNWRINQEIAGCGYFCDLGSHMIDIIQFFVDEISLVNGQASNQGKRYKVEDTVAASFIFSNGAAGTGLWCFNSFENLDATEILGTEGKIIYSTFNTSPIVLNNGKNKREEYTIENPKHIEQPLIQTVVDEILGKGKCSSTGESGSRTNWAIDKILRRI